MPKKQPPDIESTFARLTATIEALENEQCDLQESLDAFEEGVALIRSAQERLEEAEQRVNLLLEKDGKPVAVAQGDEESDA